MKTNNFFFNKRSYLTLVFVSFFFLSNVTQSSGVTTWFWAGGLGTQAAPQDFNDMHLWSQVLGSTTVNNSAFNFFGGQSDFVGYTWIIDGSNVGNAVTALGKTVWLKVDSTFTGTSGGTPQSYMNSFQITYTGSQHFTVNMGTSVSGGASVYCGFPSPFSGTGSSPYAFSIAATDTLTIESVGYPGTPSALSFVVNGNQQSVENLANVLGVINVGTGAASTSSPHVLQFKQPHITGAVTEVVTGTINVNKQANGANCTLILGGGNPAIGSPGVFSNAGNALTIKGKLSMQGTVITGNFPLWTGNNGTIEYVNTNSTANGNIAPMIIDSVYNATTFVYNRSLEWPTFGSNIPAHLTVNLSSTGSGTVTGFMGGTTTVSWGTLYNFKARTVLGVGVTDTVALTNGTFNIASGAFTIPNGSTIARDQGAFSARPTYVQPTANNSFMYFGSGTNVTADAGLEFPHLGPDTFVNFIDTKTGFVTLNNAMINVTGTSVGLKTTAGSIIISTDTFNLLGVSTSTGGGFGGKSTGALNILSSANGNIGKIFVTTTDTIGTLNVSMTGVNDTVVFGAATTGNITVTNKLTLGGGIVKFSLNTTATNPAISYMGTPANLSAGSSTAFIELPGTVSGGDGFALSSGPSPTTLTGGPYTLPIGIAPPGTGTPAVSGYRPITLSFATPSARQSIQLGYYADSGSSPITVRRVPLTGNNRTGFQVFINRTRLAGFSMDTLSSLTLSYQDADFNGATPAASNVDIFGAKTATTWGGVGQSASNGASSPRTVTQNNFIISAFDSAVVGYHFDLGVPGGDLIVPMISYTINNLFLQGYYLGNGTMSPLLHLLGAASTTAVDTVTIILYNSTFPYAAVDASTGVLQSNGTLACSFQVSTGGGTYFIAVKHRNSIKTWSAVAQQVNASGSYDYSMGGGFNNSMKALDANYNGIYAGDVNQDGNIDATDIAQLQNVLSTFQIGVYNVNDITGDGFVDEDDYRFLQDNPSNLTVQQPQ